MTLSTKTLDVQQPHFERLLEQAHEAVKHTTPGCDVFRTLLREISYHLPSDF